MNPMARLGRRHPRLIAMLILLLFMLVFSLPALLWGPVDLSDGTGLISVDYLSAAILPQLVFSLLLLALIGALRWGGATYMTTRPDPPGLRLSIWITLLPLTLFLIIVATVLVTPGTGANVPALLASIVALNLLVGLFEELLFRGVVFHGLRSAHRVSTALVGSSVLFGLFHLTNLAVGQSLAITLFQVINATAIGLLLCAIMLQARSIWPAVILHAVWNCYAMAGQVLATETDLLGDVAAAPAVTAQSYILPAMIGLSAWVVWRRWCRRMETATPPPIPTP